MDIIADLVSQLIVGFVWSVMILGAVYGGHVAHQRRMARVRADEEKQRSRARRDHQAFIRHSENVARKALYERVNGR